MYYFAYGSNLNKEQMHMRCPAAKPVGRMTLPNARLVFRGVADVEYAEGESVVGGLWKITKACEEALDRYEGVKGGLYRKEYVKIQVGKEKPRRCLVYVMNRETYWEPSPFYAGVIRQGYKDFGIDRQRLADAIDATKALQDPTVWTPPPRRIVRVVRETPPGDGWKAPPPADWDVPKSACWNPPAPLQDEPVKAAKRRSAAQEAIDRFRELTK